MGTADAKQIYKQRAATAETVNADAKAHRGMAATGLRGLDKVTGSACLFVLTYNILRFITLSASRPSSARRPRHPRRWRFPSDPRTSRRTIHAAASDGPLPAASRSRPATADPHRGRSDRRLAVPGRAANRAHALRAWARIDREQRAPEIGSRLVASGWPCRGLAGAGGRPRGRKAGGGGRRVGGSGWCGPGRRGRGSAAFFSRAVPCGSERS